MAHKLLCLRKTYWYIKILDQLLLYWSLLITHFCMIFNILILRMLIIDFFKAVTLCFFLQQNIAWILLIIWAYFAFVGLQPLTTIPAINQPVMTNVVFSSSPVLTSNNPGQWPHHWRTCQWLEIRNRESLKTFVLTYHRYNVYEVFSASIHFNLCWREYPNHKKWKYYFHFLWFGYSRKYEIFFANYIDLVLIWINEKFICVDFILDLQKKQKA